MEFKSMEQVTNYAQQESRLLVVYDTYVLDVTSFAKHHPGGSSLITNYSSKDITVSMAGHFPLSLKLADSMAIGSLQKQINSYIDTTKALSPQIWEISEEHYLKMIHMPHWVFQQSPRVFQTDFAQKLSYCSWYNILFVPYLLLFYYYKTRVEDKWTESMPIHLIILLFMSGMLLFTLTEYVLHRFVFHSEKILPDFKLARYLHFMTHGIHHMFPFDPFRLVLPPTLTVIFLTILYLTVYKFIHFQNYVYDFIFYCGFLTGYILYDLIHYAIHHMELRKGFIGKIFQAISKHHNQHHFGGEQRGYGVSSPLWDYILHTLFKNKRGE